MKDKTEIQEKLEIGDKSLLNPPIKYRKAERTRPVSNQFKFVAKHAPDIGDSVTSVTWDCCAKTLELSVDETPAFAVYNWLTTINARQAEIQRSPFSDFEQDALLLTTLDDQDRKIATLKFKNITLTNHTCYYNRNIIPDTQPLNHYIVLHYEEIEPVPDFEMLRRQMDEMEEIQKKDPNELIDEEWTTCEIV